MKLQEIDISYKLKYFHLTFFHNIIISLTIKIQKTTITYTHAQNDNNNNNNFIVIINRFS